MEINKKERIVFMGTPEFAVSSLKALIEKGYNVVGIVTVPDKPSGRGQKINMSSVKEYALGLDLPILQPVSLKDPVFLEQLKGLAGDLFIVVAFRMLPRIVWSMPRLGTFNLHASLLPDYRGAAPINWAIINGETETGITTFFLDEKIDTGAILFQERMPILPQDNVGSLYDRLMEKGAELVLKTTDAITGQNYTLISQDESKAVHPAPKITRQTCEIDWTQDAVKVLNLIRGLSPYPAPHTLLVKTDSNGNAGGHDIKIYDAEYCASAIGHTNTDGHILPGKIISDCKKELYVACGKDFLKIKELQMAGKKRLATKDFLAGWRDGFENCMMKQNTNI